MSERKTKEWIDASLGIVDSSRPYTENLIVNSKCAGNSSGYTVVATKDFVPGDIIEECLVLATHTGSYECKDPVILHHSIRHPDVQNEAFVETGLPIIIGLGNFSVYRKDSKSNAAFTFDPAFNLITIKATKKITEGEEIIFFQHATPDKTEKKTPESAPKKKKGGCGCGKNKKKKETEESETKDIPENLKRKRALTAAIAKNVEQSEEFEARFKSMVDGNNLKSIKV